MTTYLHHENKPLLPLTEQPKYLLLLQDQTCIVGTEFQCMKIRNLHFWHKNISDMFPTTRKVRNGTVTSLSKLIDEE